MNKSPINVDIDWDNIITYYSTLNTKEDKDESDILITYGPPLDLYSSLREQIEDDSGIDINKTKHLLNINDNITRKHIVRAINIMKITCKYATDVDNFVVFAQPHQKWNLNKNKSEWIRDINDHPNMFKIDIGGKAVTLYEIITNNQLFDEYLNWWCQFIEY
jgi:hypothetical protein